MSSASLPLDYYIEDASVGPSDFDGVYKRMLSLELELVEFQESSKELEQALEEELRELESRNSDLLAQVRTKDLRIHALSDKIIQLNTELNNLHDEMVEKTEAYNKESRELKSKLVSVEILNDDMVSNDRVLESKLQLSTQFNNELLEKLAIVENDLELEKQENAKHRLAISNLENFNKSHRFSRRLAAAQGLESEDVTFADGTILDINEMLASEPAKPTESRIPKSGSLTKVQSFIVKSEVLRQKAEDMSTTLASYTGDESSRRHSRLAADNRDEPTRVSKSIERRSSAKGAGKNEAKLERPSTEPRQPVPKTAVHMERTSSLPVRGDGAAESLSLPPGTVRKSASLRQKSRGPPKKQGFRTSVKRLFF